MASTGTPVSLTLRLTLGFVGVLVAAHVGICLYLDYAFQEEFRREDMRELSAHLSFVQQVLAEQNSFQALRVDSRRLLDARAPHPRLEFVLRDSWGRMVESSYEARSLAESILQQARSQGSAGESLGTFAYQGRVWRALIASGTLGDGARTSVAVVVALDVTDRENFVSRYRSRLVTAAVVAIVVAGFVGLPLVQQALSPIRVMARRAREISSNRLNARLPVGSVPRELRILSEAFNETLERLEESFRRLSQFSSDVAHELRTPISNLMGEAQVALRRARSAPEYRAALQSAIEECQRVTRMVDAMLFLARADSAQIALRRELLDGRQEVARVVEEYTELLTDHGVQLRITGSTSIWADQELLRRALSNLMDNAITHTPKGETIDVSLGMGPDSSSIIEISNPGAGIPADALPRIFDRFFRIQDGRKPAQGFGLGLAIVRTIVRLHGGSASVRSAPEGPTVFTLFFPGDVRPAADDAGAISLGRRGWLGPSPT
ncbi:MAG TPA: heavy metal sensor histidine kinase [Burkholderiales bacterium]|nr:heavy metal sensor histidine kinase [Burkholderiales bacterium]